jgi:hypothetical protein
MRTAMAESGVELALERSERAIARIEAAVRQATAARQRDERLRARVRDAIVELDQLIQAAGG